MDQPIELIELRIEQYKNLERVRVEWGPRLVIIGENGTGKTNLLEAAALAFGTRATLWQVAGRAAQPDFDAISVVVRTHGLDLPLVVDASLRDGPDEWRRDVAFWDQLGVGDGAGTWDEVWRRSDLPEALCELLAGVEHRSLIRYRLASLTGLDDARRCDRASEFSDVDPSEVEFHRTYSRCLLVERDVFDPELLSHLSVNAEQLPGPFGPFRAWVSAVRTDGDTDTAARYVELLELPPVDDAPIRVVWLPAERTAGEAWFDLAEAYERALEPVELLAARTWWWSGDHDDDDEEEDTDQGSRDRREFESAFRWWLLATVAETLDRFLRDRGSQLEAFPQDDFLGSVLIERSGSPVGFLDDAALFHRLSSGERAWLDIGLAHAAAALEAAASDATWLARGLWQLYDEAAEELRAYLQELSGAGDMGDPREINHVVAWAKRLVKDPIRALWGEHKIPERFERYMVRAQSREDPAWREVLADKLTIQVYDEPERHLHPRAQRAVARFLGEHRDRELVAVATHSHYFLGLPGWRHLSIERTPEGVVVHTFDPHTLDVADHLARSLGLQHGELFNRYSYVLFVEGPADRAVLETLYGPLLADVGVLILPIHGLKNVKHLAELHLVGKILDVDAGLLSDNTRLAVVEAAQEPSDATEEEKALRRFAAMLQRRGRQMQFFGLDRSDICEYLDEEAVRAQLPLRATFSGWEAVRQHTKKMRSTTGKGNTKQAFKELTGMDVTFELIEATAMAMAEAGARTLDDLPDKVADVVAAARLRTDSPSAG